ARSGRGVLLLDRAQGRLVLACWQGASQDPVARVHRSGRRPLPGGAVLRAVQSLAHPPERNGSRPVLDLALKLHESTAHTLAGRLARRELSARELVEATYARI